MYGTQSLVPRPSRALEKNHVAGRGADDVGDLRRRVLQRTAIDRLVGGSGDGSDGDVDVALLRDIGKAMRDASICGLGQTAYNAVETAVVRLGMWGSDPMSRDGAS